MNVPSTLIDLQTGLFRSSLTAHEQAGFELGWDYAHYRLAPPAAWADEVSALRSGLAAGRAAFGARTLVAGRHVRQWLQLRLHAWLRGRSVERVQVTPNYLRQIDVAFCPITRVALSGAPEAGPDEMSSDAVVAPVRAEAEIVEPGGQPPSIDRVRDDAGYAAGNLAVMSRRANHAKGTRRHAEAAAIAERLEAEPAGAQVDGLGAAEWARVATLCSFVEPMPHAEACRLPMRVLPPNRLRLFNPVQALQAFVCRQFLKAGWSQRVTSFETMLPDATARHAFKSFFLSLLPRMIEAGRAEHPAAAAWAIEDAWRDPRVLRRWERFASGLDAAQCTELLTRAAAGRLATGVVMPLSGPGATDGWALATRGYLAPAARPSVREAERPQRQLAW